MTKVRNSEKYFETKQIETFIGFGKDGSSFAENGDMIGERRKLIILHQNGNDKNALLAQLKTLIYGIETDFESFSC